MNASVAVTDVRLTDLAHPQAELCSWIAGQPGALRQAMLAGQTASLTLAVAMGLHHIINNLFHERRPGNFFDSTSCNTALSKLSSATSFFSRAFSSASCFSSRTCSDSRPAYLFARVDYQSILRLTPPVVGPRRNAHLSDQVRNRQTKLCLLESSHNLLRGISSSRLCHRSVSFFEETAAKLTPNLDHSHQTTSHGTGLRSPHSSRPVS